MCNELITGKQNLISVHCMCVSSVVTFDLKINDSCSDTADQFQSIAAILTVCLRVNVCAWV